MSRHLSSLSLLTLFLLGSSLLAKKPNIVYILADDLGYGDVRFVHEQAADAKAAKQGLPSVQIYDLSADLGETKNLSAEHPTIVSQLTQKLETSIANGRSTPGTQQTNDADIVIFKNNARKN